jgi:TonB-linked SusC/RagA family outer membrane protein
VITAAGDAGESAFLGYLGRLSYDYAQRYLLTTTVRRDGTSIFSPEGGRRWGTFPSVSAAWRVSEEPFFRVPGVSEFKLRGSWGELGNSETLAYPFLTRVGPDPDYGLGDGTVKAPAPINFVNPNLTWETVRTTDVGFEAGFFRNTLDLTATYYRKDTRNFLVTVPLPQITGFQNVPVNAGSVRNAGVELELGYTPQLRNGLRFNASANLTTVRNRLLALTPGVSEFRLSVTDTAYRTAVGQPIGSFYGFRTAGLYQTQADADAAPEDKTTGRKAAPGDVRFVDLNGDGQITADDRTYLGKTIPDFFYGFNLNGGWRRFDVSAFFQGVQGVEIYNQFRRDAEHLGGGASPGRNQLRTTAGRWTGPGTSASMPRAVATDPNNNQRISDRFVENGSYFRLKNLQLGYTLPPQLLRGRLNQARVYLSGTNLLTFTGYSGLDPEVQTWGADEFGVSLSANQLRAGTDFGNIPQPRIFQFGLTVGF